jgi:hypothetical protein
MCKKEALKESGNGQNKTSMLKIKIEGVHKEKIQKIMEEKKSLVAQMVRLSRKLSLNKEILWDYIHDSYPELDEQKNYRTEEEENGDIFVVETSKEDGFKDFLSTLREGVGMPPGHKQPPGISNLKI